MNSIKYLDNYIRKSSFELHEKRPNLDTRFNTEVKVTLSFPQAPQVGQKIRCMLDLTIGEKNNTPTYIFIQLHVVFEIEQIDEEKELEKYAQDFCIKQAMEIMQSKLARLTELHIGEPLEFPLTDHL